MKSSGNIQDQIKLPEIVSKLGSPFETEADKLPEEFFDSGYEIEVIAGADKGAVYPLFRKEVTLGKKEKVGYDMPDRILFVDPSVSKEHAVIKWDRDLEKYVIYHLSPTTPTMVNGRSIKKSLLNSDYEVQLGKIVFRIVSIEEKRKRESSAIWSRFKTGEERGEEHISSGYKLVIVEGPDKGLSFTLDKNLIIIGRRKSAADKRDTYGILLSDKTLPEELALLVWDENQKKFCIFQSEDSTVPVRLFRVVDTYEGSKVIGREYMNVLEDKDTILAGETVMAIHRTIEGETPEAKIDIEKELKAEQTPAAPDEPGAKTAASSFRVDYVFEIIKGQDTGHRISLLSDEIHEGKTITFGSKGKIRQNDIEFDDYSLANDQGYFEFNQGSLYLINEKPTPEIMVNSYEIGENEKIMLNGGDRIQLGDTTLAFTDNRVIAALKNYRLVIVSSPGHDQGKSIPISKTMIFIGRGSACDVRIIDPEVSRLHAVMTFKSSRFYLEHKSKVNPTFVNGISLKKNQDRIIFPGDKIYLSGNTIIQLVKD